MNAPRERSTPPSAPIGTAPATGVARVVCYSPRHDLTLAELEVDGVDALLRDVAGADRELAAHAEVDYVLVFENKGEVVGVSNPHPHCQIYATNFIFKTIETEARGRAALSRATGRVLFQDIIAAERTDGRRIIAENDTAIAFVPYFARYAYEVYVAPKSDASDASPRCPRRERRDFATVLARRGRFGSTTSGRCRSRT